VNFSQDKKVGDKWKVSHVRISHSSLRLGKTGVKTKTEGELCVMARHLRVLIH